MSNFCLHLGLKLSFEHNRVCKTLLLKACFCWDSKLALLDMDQKLNSGGTIGYGDLYFENFFCHSKVVRLHTILHDALEQYDHIVLKVLANVTN